MHLPCWGQSEVSPALSSAHLSNLVSPGTSFCPTLVLLSYQQLPTRYWSRHRCLYCTGPSRLLHIRPPSLSDTSQVLPDPPLQVRLATVPLSPCWVPARPYLDNKLASVMLRAVISSQMCLPAPLPIPNRVTRWQGPCFKYCPNS